MSTLTDLQKRLDRLNAAIHSGHRSVTSEDGASVDYRNLDEMLAARRDLQSQIAAAVTPSRRHGLQVARVNFVTRRG